MTRDAANDPDKGPALAPSRRNVSAGTLLILAGAMLLATIIVAAICTLFGQAQLGWSVWNMRLARVMVAAVVGAGLAVSGTALQGLLRNPLADPYILGISSGAGVGYLAGLALCRYLGVQALASATWPTLAGALLTCLVVYMLAQRRGRLDPYVLILAGVIVNVINGAIIMSLLVFVHRGDIVDFIGWGFGQIPEGLSATNPTLLPVCAAAVLGGWLFIFLRSPAMNVMGLGDEVAASSGVAVHGLRIETFMLVSAMTAAAVALAGPVGFVGLIIPHVCRLIFGPDHRKLAVASGFAGAIFLMAADTFCHVAGDWFQKGLLPLGVVTAAIGGPLFIVLLRRHGRERR